MKTNTKCDWCMIDSETGKVKNAKHIVQDGTGSKTNVCSQCFYIHYCTAFGYTFDGGNEMYDTNRTTTGMNPDCFVVKFDRADFNRVYGVSYIY
tara:strand:+ start:788 stop:1069 length:282 start_codon:yes stop_codon:yes gene_type:complete